LLSGAVPIGGLGSVPSLRALGYKPFYDRLNVAAIGCGGQGGVDLNDAAKSETIVALCDVDQARAAINFNRFDKQPKFKDYRRMLDKEGRHIDAVTIGIPDHMHAAAALACMQMGKHVYCEKPLTRTPWEARLLKDAAAKYKVATQMGNQGFSHESHRVAAEMVWSGAIGDVKEVHVCTTPDSTPRELQALPPEEGIPSTLAWDEWLGAAQKRPYSSYYVPYNWRAFLEFGTGQIGNWATHTAGPAQTALQLCAPVSLERISVKGESKITYPTSASVRLEFPARGSMPPVTMFYHEAATAAGSDVYRVPGMENEIILPPPSNLAPKGRPMEARRRPANSSGPQPGSGRYGVRNFSPRGTEPPQPGVLTGNGSLLVGTRGMMATVDRGEGVHLLPSARWAEYVLPPPLLTRSPGHMADWIRACKGGEPGCADFSITAPYAEWLALVAIALVVPGKLLWDADHLRFTNSAQANQLVKPSFRPGRELKL